MAAANDTGYKIGTAPTPAQIATMMLAYKRATVDFSAGGSEDLWVPQALGAFYHAGVQSIRSDVRAFNLKDQGTKQFDPYKRASSLMLSGITLLTIPAILNYLRYKDEEWYKDLTWREKLAYFNIEWGDQIIQIPTPIGAGAFFVAPAVFLMDKYFNEDPKSAEELVYYLFKTYNPVDLPVSVKLIIEQYANKSLFTNRPIVTNPRLPNEDQSNEYTTGLANFLGKLGGLSPQRIDHVIRSLGSSMTINAINAPAQLLQFAGAYQGVKEQTKTDIPVIGKMFKDKFTATQSSIMDFYADTDKYLPRLAALNQSDRDPQNPPPVNPMTDKETSYAQELSDVTKSIAEDFKQLRTVYSNSDRQRIYQDIARQCKDALALKKDLRL